MTTHKAFALLCFLLCFCFLSTSYAQPCLTDNDLANEYNSQLSLEESPESNALLNNNAFITANNFTTQIVEFSVVENQKNHTLPRCNRGPPPHNVIKHKPIH